VANARPKSICRARPSAFSDRGRLPAYPVGAWNLIAGYGRAVMSGRRRLSRRVAVAGPGSQATSLSAALCDPSPASAVGPGDVVLYEPACLPLGSARRYGREARQRHHGGWTLWGGLSPAPCSWPLTEFLAERYGWRGAHRELGGAIKHPVRRWWPYLLVIRSAHDLAARACRGTVVARPRAGKRWAGSGVSGDCSSRFRQLLRQPSWW